MSTSSDHGANPVPADRVEACPAAWPTGWADGRLGEPILVLAAVSSKPPTTGHDWRAIEHQTAGVCCHHHRMWATLLTPTPAALEGMLRLERKWFGSNVGRGGPDATLCAEYRGDLRSLFGGRVDFTGDADQFEEAIYPIDLSSEALDALVSARLCISLNHPSLKLLILGANSD